MKTRTKHTLSQVLADYKSAKFPEEFATEWAAVVLYRPLAIPLAWALQYGPVSPMAVTFAGLLCLPGMVLCAGLLPAAVAMTAVVVLAMVFMVLDCVDGTLARITNRTSREGRYADFASDVAYRLVFYGSAGFLLQQYSTPESGWLAAGSLPAALVSAWLMTFARLCRVYAELHFSRPSQGESTQQSWRVGVAGFISGLDGLMPLVAGVAWLTGMAAVFIVWAALFAIMDFVYTQARVLQLLRESDR